MQAQLLKVPPAPTYSFTVRDEMAPNINSKWHYHEEAELIFFYKGSGTQFVGDSIQSFGEGDIVLVGPNLPHCWQFDKSAADEIDDSPFSTVIHFNVNLWGNTFLQLPETGLLKKVLNNSKRGIFIPAGKETGLTSYIKKMKRQEGIDRILGLLNCLVMLANSPHIVYLTSQGYQSKLAGTSHDRINAVYDFSFHHFKKNIYLKEIAAIAGMVPNAFCRYFKAKTGKTYSEFLTEVRIGYACKLLIQNRLSNKQICFESGFNSLTYFHKCFRRLKKESPLSYQQKFAVRADG